MTNRRFAFIGALAGVLALSGCIVVPVGQVTVGGGDSGPEVATAAPTQMGAELNAARAANGLPPVVPSAALMAAARDQAGHMARTGEVTHTGAGGSRVGQRARRAGCSFTWVAENVAWGQPTDQATMAAWMQSAGHRSNNLNPRARSYGSAEAGGYRALVLGAGC